MARDSLSNEMRRPWMGGRCSYGIMVKMIQKGCNCSFLDDVGVSKRSLPSYSYSVAELRIMTNSARHCPSEQLKLRFVGL